MVWAELAADELIEIVGKENLSLEQANHIIMAARAHWFKSDKDNIEPK